LKVCLLSGGTGTPKFIQGLKNVIPQENISVIVNTGEDTIINGLYLSPDIDTVLYTFSDLINEDTWYGVRNDTFFTHETIKKYETDGFKEILRIGDKDRALKLHKTYFLNKGYSLSKVVDMERKMLKIKSKIYPMSDDKVETKILIEENGEKYLIKFHDFWINRKGQCNVLDVFYEGSNYANVCETALEDLEKCDVVIIGPSNPITSIGPILSIKDIRKILMEKFVIGISPFIGNKPVSGPASVLMRCKNYESNPEGLYNYYKKYLDVIILDSSDKDKDYNINCNLEYTDIFMDNMDKKINLAKYVLNTIEKYIQ